MKKQTLRLTVLLCCALPQPIKSEDYVAWWFLKEVCSKTVAGISVGATVIRNVIVAPMAVEGLKEKVAELGLKIAEDKATVAGLTTALTQANADKIAELGATIIQQGATIVALNNTNNQQGAAILTLEVAKAGLQAANVSLSWATGILGFLSAGLAGLSTYCYWGWCKAVEECTILAKALADSQAVNTVLRASLENLQGLNNTLKEALASTNGLNETLKNAFAKLQTLNGNLQTSLVSAQNLTVKLRAALQRSRALNAQLKEALFETQQRLAAKMLENKYLWIGIAATSTCAAVGGYLWYQQRAKTATAVKQLEQHKKLIGAINKKSSELVTGNLPKNTKLDDFLPVQV